VIDIRTGDCRELLRAMPAASVQTCVTSPPYFGLRDYGVAGQIGLEQTPDEYVAQMVDVFREVRRVLRDDGTLWLNLGDSYLGGGGFAPDAPCNKARAEGDPSAWGKFNPAGMNRMASKQSAKPKRLAGLKPKDLIGIPWRVAFALQADDWYLRQDIIWHKPNPMPESVRDRCTKAHEYVFLMSKRERYYYDAAAISEPATHAGKVLDYTGEQKNNKADPDLQRTAPRGRKIEIGDTRNRRSVWSITSEPFSGAHFATMPPALAELCVKAGSKPGDTVLDPFGGAGTTGLVADRLQRSAILLELNPQYADMARERVRADAPLFATVLDTSNTPARARSIHAGLRAGSGTRSFADRTDPPTA
jgi:DNA modification methylase